MRTSLALIALLAAQAHAQTISIAIKVQSVWAPVAAQGVSISGVTVAPLRTVNTVVLDPVTKQPVLDTDGSQKFTTSYAVIAGKTQKIAEVKWMQTPLVAVFPGSKTTMMMISGLRFTVGVSGPGWRLKDPAIIDVEVMPTMGFPAGQQVAMRYDAPSFTTAGGTIQLIGCPMTVTAAACLATIPPAPDGPVVTGPITPVGTPPGTPVPPTPTPIAVTNPVGDCVAAALGEWCSHLVTQLTDKEGKVWTLSGNIVLRDKVEVRTNRTDINRLYMSPLNTGNVRIDGPSYGYSCLVLGAWVVGC